MKTIKIKETSKSGVIANIDGVFGQLLGGIFVAYSEEELLKKTAYKDAFGWVEYQSIEEYFEFRKNFNEERKIKNAEFAKRCEEKRSEENRQLMKMISEGPIEATVENIKLLLLWLNEQNWGSWTLPKLSIGYSAHQYDCEGVTATTIKLDKPISDEEYGIENETMFKVGGKRGHLNKYQSI